MTRDDGGRTDRDLGADVDTLLTPHAALPVRRRFDVGLPGDERETIRSRAADIASRDPELRADAPGSPRVTPGLSSGPGLVIHDISWTRPAAEAGPSVLEYRALLLAGDGDEVAIGCHRSAAFEARTRALLGLGDVNVHRVERATAGNLAAAARHDDPLLDRLAGRAREAGRFAVRPYIASPEVWALAREIADRAGVPVTVAGPPAALARRVNNKLWFTEQAHALLGAGSTPPTAPAEDLDALVDRIRELGGPRDQVAVRLRSAAAGEGNLVIPKAALTESLPALESMLGQLFSALEWDDIFPLQVAVWEAPVLASPSVQVWVPRAGDGSPVVEGVMEQWFEGEGSAFSGAVASTLPDDVQQALAREALVMATCFQELGYLGRCSFDAILVDDDPVGAAIHWVECNGRWGGASIPMTAAERLVGDWRRRPFTILSLERPSNRRVPAAEAYEILDELCLEPGGREGVLLLSPTALETGQGLDLMAIAGSRDRAGELADGARDRLLGTTV